ncbi:Mediator of RNA polymerase II transcription subunit 11 [Wickerhamomyces ciferrii]|uniref:Mediator of RNA polymerase II transcription subunit 11 n=1 Tax=Wickerhamomyces ciferrii (strain ATCC 14091 / BCRC 22168 / CBS 111 / JCM 3599 / NBRC 0793 / NRRL Y-1031 F-60-10) TaxID=1206466 RepID=K0KFZ8_WICCF|nr:Mediator of RNA polymerase II transcription subunit 11 [Wickerhamomyces ciferrii]CCH41137.1 Mediator of RNA polymerase II transcription subunit 11 [Wickerhamomyces ciferrii]
MPDEQHQFVQDRLDALHEIDAKLVSVLNHSSSALFNLTQLKKNASNKNELAKVKEDYQKDIKEFYSDLEFASINLKKEIKHLDDRIGKTDDNGITILPININKKATWAGEEKLKQQLNHIDENLK